MYKKKKFVLIWSERETHFLKKVALLEASSNEDTLIRCLNLREFRPNLCLQRRPQEIDVYHGSGYLPTDIHITEESRGSEQGYVGKGW